MNEWPQGGPGNTQPPIVVGRRYRVIDRIPNGRGGTKLRTREGVYTGSKLQPLYHEYRDYFRFDDHVKDTQVFLRDCKIEPVEGTSDG